MSTDWLVKENDRLKGESEQLPDWVKVQIGTTAFTFNLEVPSKEKTTSNGKIWLWTLIDGKELMTSKVLHSKLVKFFSSHQGVNSCKIVRTGEKKDTRWEVIGNLFT